jgi:hypothetical protein
MKIIFGVAFNRLVALSPPSAVMSSARLCTTKTCASSAVEPPVVPAPDDAQPSFAASVWRANCCAAADGTSDVPALAGHVAAMVIPATAHAATTAMVRARMRYSSRLVSAAGNREESAFPSHTVARASSAVNRAARPQAGIEIPTPPLVCAP